MKLSSVLTLFGGLGALGFGTVLGAIVKGWYDRSQARLTGEQNAEIQSLQRIHQGKLQDVELKGQQARQASEHRHQRDMLAQAAHFEVRKETATLALNVKIWWHNEFMTRFGDEADVFPQHIPSGGFADPGAVIGALMTIGSTHPTAAVRNAARELSDQISRALNEIDVANGRMRIPTSSDFSDWGTLLDQLIELTNEPPAPADQPARPALSVPQADTDSSSNS